MQGFSSRYLRSTGRTNPSVFAQDRSLTKVGTEYTYIDGLNINGRGSAGDASLFNQLRGAWDDLSDGE